MDGKDLWVAYNIFVEDGSDDFMKMPERKPSIEHDWGDSPGIDVDTSRASLPASRTIPLDLAIIVQDTDEFWEKYNGFFADLMQPGKRRWVVAAHKGFSYYVVYQKSDSVKMVTKWKNTGLLAAKFQLTLLEPEPTIGRGDIFLADEDGRLIIT